MVLGQNGCHFPNDIFKCISVNENVWVLFKSLLQFVPRGPINNIAALVQIMACCRPGDKLLSEPMMVSLLMYICVTRPQWAKITTKCSLLTYTAPLFVLMHPYNYKHIRNWMIKLIGYTSPHQGCYNNLSCDLTDLMPDSFLVPIPGYSRQLIAPGSL